MENNGYQFEMPKHHSNIIKAIGVGGAGSNAINSIYQQGITKVDLVICNTDLQALKNSEVSTKLQIGAHLTEGLGAGANPEIGRNAALESKEEIRELLGDNTKMLFITAGMGGGTGTGAAPVIASIAKEMNILTVGIVTSPFIIEGSKKMKNAQMGIELLRQYCDTVLVILNEKLIEIHSNLTVESAFKIADNVVATAAKGIAEIITTPGYSNVDFKDIETVLKGAGAAVMGSSQTNGENRAIRAAEDALACPLLDIKNIEGASHILLSISYGDKAEFLMSELSEIATYIQSKSGNDAEIIMGNSLDKDLEDNIKVTVIVTGFSKSINHTKTQSGLNMGIPKSTQRKYDLEKPTQMNIFNQNNMMEDKSNMSDNEENLILDNHLTNEIEKDFEIVDETKSDQEINDLGMMDKIDTKERMRMKQKERLETFKSNGLLSNDMNPEQFKEKLEVPAYIRKKIKLPDSNLSSQSNISRYNLNDENKILGNNKFLHDNVD